MSNTFGEVFRITTYGESHGPAMGVIIDGCPAGLDFDPGLIQRDLLRRRPGQSSIASERKESDEFELQSGVYEGKTTGHPIGILIRNKDQRSEDYEHLEETYRPSHADYTYQEKYGIRDPRGGGRSSARETANWVVGGAVAKMLLSTAGVSVHAFVSSVGDIDLVKPYYELDLSKTDSNIVRCPDAKVAAQMEALIKEVQSKGDTIGGAISGAALSVPVGWGHPIFNKLDADLAKALLTINATKGFEIGSGFGAIRMAGSRHNDKFISQGGKIRTSTNYSGGIQGGISNGEDLYFRVAFKPVSTLMVDQESVNKDGKRATVEGKGRHDPCVVPRAVPIVEAMTALVLADHFLLSKVSRI